MIDTGGPAVALEFSGETTTASGAPTRARGDAAIDRRAFVLTAVALLGGFAVARTWILASAGTPSGIDTGNWLSFGNGLLGHPVKPSGISYPPAIPLLVASVVRPFGPTLGVALIGGLSAVMPALAVLLALGWGRLGMWAVGLAGLVLGLHAVGEITAWGGFPQLLAAPFVVTFLWFLDRSLLEGRARDIALVALAFGGVLATSHLAALGAVVAAPVVVAARAAGTEDRVSVLLRRFLAVLAALGVAALPLIVIYARIIPAVLQTQLGEGPAPSVGLARLPSEFLRVHGWAWPLLLLGLVAALGAALFPSRSRDSLWCVAIALAVGTTATALLTGEPRVFYDVPVVAALGYGLWLRIFLGRTTAADRSRGAVAAVLAVTVGVVGLTGLADFDRQRRSFGVLDTDAVAALLWLRDRTPEGSVVVVPTLDGMPLAWWVEGLAERPTLGVIAPRWLVYPKEREVAEVAIRVLRAFDDGIPRGERVARAVGVDFVLVPRSSDLAAVLQVYLDAGRVEPAYSNASMTVLAVMDRTSS